MNVCMFMSSIVLIFFLVHLTRLSHSDVWPGTLVDNKFLNVHLNACPSGHGSSLLLRRKKNIFFF